MSSLTASRHRQWLVLPLYQHQPAFAARGGEDKAAVCSETASQPASSKPCEELLQHMQGGQFAVNV